MYGLSFEAIGQLGLEARKRIPLATKQAHKGFYKGMGGTKEARLTSKGRRFTVDLLRRLQPIIPRFQDRKVGSSRIR